MNAEETVQINKALSDISRVKIVEMLASKEMSATSILEVLPISQSTLSHHLQILTECSLLTSRRSGKFTLYTLDKEVLREFQRYYNTLQMALPPTQN